MRPELPRGTVTLLFTDIEGSTRLLHERGPDEYSKALAEHRRILREAFSAYGGVEVDTQGDAFFVAFTTADGAAAAATTAMEQLARGPIRVRMGLHTGAPTLAEEGYVGVDVHRGARVAALAYGAQVVVSPTTAALLAQPLRDLGLHRLKDFEGAIRLYQLGDGDFPPLRTPGSVELPVPATRFVGREHELFDAVSLVYERDPRVLTILGPGGTGKTRFALELARLLADEAVGGTVFVPLAPLRDASLVLYTIADSLGAPSDEPVAIAARIGDKRTHVLLDNAEHLLPDAALPLADLTAQAPTLRLLVTSREPLRIQGEAELDLPPLSSDEAVALFVERARSVRPDVDASPAVREICTRLDGLPLALELAAARTKLLAPDALSERLTERLDLLRGTRDADDRHATLRATIDWSYALLDEDERRLFGRLSAFRGSCTLESAERVCGADLDVLASLLDKSLIRRRASNSGEDRYWMLETIREYALERLRESGEEPEVRRRHLEWALALAESANLYVEASGPFRHDIVLADREDIRAALDWGAANDPVAGLQLAMLLENLWAAHSPAEGEERMKVLMAAAGPLPDDLQARALRVYGNAALMIGDLDAGKDAYERSFELYRAGGDELGTAVMEHRLAVAVMSKDGDPGDVRRMCEHALGVFRRHEFERGIAQAQGTLAELYEAEGNLELALELRHDSLERARRTGFVWWEAYELLSVARIEQRQGRLDAALAAARAAAPLVRRMEDEARALVCLVRIALISLERDDSKTAGRLWGAASASDERRGGELQTQPHTRPLRESTSPDFVAAVAEGRSLDVWDAVAVALGEDDLDQTVP